MSILIDMNEIRKIQNVLEDYLEKRVAEKVAIKIYKVMQEDSSKKVESKFPISKFETIEIQGSKCDLYEKLMKHKPRHYSEKLFMNNLREAINHSIKTFHVFVNDPSIKDGKLQFYSGYVPDIGESYEELESIAKKNNLRLGSKNEYILFMGNIIHKLINEGWNEKDAWHSVCVDSNELGHYSNSKDSSFELELTGSRKIAGKCDMANTFKILAKDDKNDCFWIASGGFNCNSKKYPLTYMYTYSNFKYAFYVVPGVGWYVF